MLFPNNVKAQQGMKIPSSGVTFMTLPLRVLSITLCCVMGLGYAPAWLHVATCDGNHAPKIMALAAPAATCGCGHSHEHGRSIDVDVQTEDSENTPHRGHDSDSCPICQSLSNAKGVATELNMPPVSSLVSWPISQPNDTIFVAPSHSTVQPRGPPAVS